MHSRKRILQMAFAVMGTAMFAFTVRASLERSIFDNADLMQDVWFQATLADAYFAFLSVIVWIATQERSWMRTGIWALLVLTLGSMAIAVWAILWLQRHCPEKETGVSSK